MKYLKWLFFFLLFLGNAYSNIQNHLKKVEGKIDSHQMRNIDFIYMINLDQRPEKWRMSTEQLDVYGIYPHRFSAVNGWELSLKTINDIGLKYAHGMKGRFLGTSYHPDGNFKPSHEKISNYGQTYFVHTLSRGAMGCILSHLSVLQDAYDSGYETVWIMEDDIDVIRDPHMLSDMIEELDTLVGKGNWDMLFTDRNFRNKKCQYEPCTGAAKHPSFNPKKPNNYKERTYLGDFIKIGARFGSASIIYRRSGMKKILNFFKAYSIFLPFDMYMYLPLEIKIYTVKRDVVSNLCDAISDLGRPRYQKNDD